MQGAFFIPSRWHKRDGLLVSGSQYINYGLTKKQVKKQVKIKCWNPATAMDSAFPFENIKRKIKLKAS